MKENNLHDTHKPCMIAFLFDSGKIDDSFYGDVVFENIFEGEEITHNSHKIVFSEGDIFDRNIYDDITPFIICDKLCTIPKSEERYTNILYAVLLEDIEEQIAIDIDSRLKNDFPAYVGMTSIDMQSSDSRKQFWKHLIRSFSAEGQTITSFSSEEEGGFNYAETVNKLGFNVNYDGFPDEFNVEKRDNLFSTRQSSFIQSLKQLEIINGHNDSDRGISEMNFSLVKEVEIAGVQIWKAIEDINLAYIPKNGDAITDYLFTSLYQAAQGVERLLKIIIELIMYGKNEIEKQKVCNLLMGHNHPAMFDFISKKENVSLNSNCKRILNILSDFYSKARYHRFSYSENNLLELKILQNFGRDIKENGFDEQVKHLYGKSLGKTAQTLYRLIDALSGKLNIYVYELNSKSVARFVLMDYYGDDLYKTLKQIEQAKRELIWYLMKKGNELPAAKIAEEILPLPFEQCYIADYVEKIITNETASYELYDFVSYSYDEIIQENKEKWKERIEAIDALVGNPNVTFDEDEIEDEI